MAIYRDSLGNIIDTQGTSQPAAYQLVSPIPTSVPASLNAGVTSTADINYHDVTTGNLVADRS